MRHLIAISAAAVALLGLAACGGDDDETSTPAPATSTPTVDSGPTGSTGPVDTSTTTDSTGLPEERCKDAESPPNIVNVVSYGADCGAVEDAMSEIRSVSENFRIGDFECTRISGSELSGTWECRGEATYFTFEFAD